MLDIAKVDRNNSLVGADDTIQTISIKNAEPQREYYCPYCNARVHKSKSSAGNEFFRCYPGEQHTAQYCQFIVKHNYTIAEFDFEAFFSSVLSKKKTTTGKRERRGGKLISTEGDGGPAIEPQGHVGSPPNTEGSDDLQMNLDDDEDDSDEPISLDMPSGGDIGNNTPTKRISSLSNIWRCGLQELAPETTLGENKIIDVFVSVKLQAAQVLFEDGFCGRRVIQTRPDAYNYRVPSLIFRCGVIKDGEQWVNIRLALVFTRETKHIFNEKYKKLWKKVPLSSGTSKKESQYKYVLIAGDWQRVDKPDCEKWCYKNSKCKNCKGLYKTRFVSGNQLYLAQKIENTSES